MGFVHVWSYSYTNSATIPCTDVKLPAVGDFIERLKLKTRDKARSANLINSGQEKKKGITAKKSSSCKVSQTAVQTSCSVININIWVRM